MSLTPDGSALEMTEIRWHGRGGQGAKTAAVLLADLAISTGQHAQAFPEYGPERMGAPVVSYNRLSPKPIIIHTPILEPDYVVILDPTFIGQLRLGEGLKDDGQVLVNSPAAPEAIRAKLALPSSVTVYTLDASDIAETHIGRPIPNTPMVAALIKVLDLVSDADLEMLIGDKLRKKFRGNEGLVRGNLEAISRAYREVNAQ